MCGISCVSCGLKGYTIKVHTYLIYNSWAIVYNGILQYAFDFAF